MTLAMSISYREPATLYGKRDSAVVILLRIWRWEAYPGYPGLCAAAAAAAAAKSLQSCTTLCDPIDSSSPGSAIPGILQARTLEWVAIYFSSAWKWKVKVKSLSCVRLFATPWTAAYQAPPSMGFSRQEYCSGLPLPSPWVMWEGPNCNHKRARKENMERDFPDGLVVEDLVANAGVTGLIPLGWSRMLWSS